MVGLQDLRTIGPRPSATNCRYLTFNVTDEAPEPLELL